MRQFTNRANLDLQFVTNEHGITRSKREINEAKRAAKKARKNAQEKVKKLENQPFYAGGKDTGSTVGQVSQQLMRPSIAGIIVPDEFDFNKIETDNQFNQQKSRAEKRAQKKYYDDRMKTMKENYLKVIDATFNSYGEKLREALEQLPADDFLELYSMMREFAFTLYDSEGNDDDEISDKLKGEADALFEYVEMYKRGELNNDLKNFDKPPK